MRHWVALVGALLTVSSSSSSAWAWAERGHDVVTQVAVRLVEARMGDDRRLVDALIARSGMLGHLSNAPDIVWRAADPATIAANGPTHYVSLDLLAWPDAPSLATLPLSLVEAERRAAAQHRALVPDVGTAPWRVAELARLMEEALARVPTGSVDRRALEAPVNEVLLYAGLLSHFVADLTMPDHVCSAFDGWEHGQGGLHAYFEGSLVDELSQALRSEVRAAALAEEPTARLVDALDPSLRDVVRRDPLRLAFLLALDAYRERDRMHRLDREVAVLSPSHVDGEKRTPAERRPARRVVGAFEAILVARLAVAADAVATLWMLAWERGGRPDLTRYQSYAYPVAPPFVPVDYMPATAQGAGTVTPAP